MVPSKTSHRFPACDTLSELAHCNLQVWGGLLYGCRGLQSPLLPYPAKESSEHDN